MVWIWVVFISIFSGKSILNSSRCLLPNEDPSHPLDNRGAEEVGAGPKAPEAAWCAVVFPVSAAGAVVAVELDEVGREGVLPPALRKESCDCAVLINVRWDGYSGCVSFMREKIWSACGERWIVSICDAVETVARLYWHSFACRVNPSPLPIAIWVERITQCSGNLSSR